MITPSALLRDTVASLASLRLTVALLVLASVLVVLATLDQINLGVWAAQQKYLRTFVVTLTPAGSTFQIPVFPGGYLVGGALLANLLCAQFRRLSPTWRQLGLHLAHAGLALLLVGELLSGLVSAEGRLTLRPGETHRYHDFSLTLLSMHSETYPGTEIVRDYSSRLRLAPAGGAEREVDIRMNRPLRHRGLAFYQSSFEPGAVTYQVVQNPGRLIPYVASGLLGLGLLYHFALMLTRHLARRAAARTEAATAPNTGQPAPGSPRALRYLPALAAALALLLVVTAAIPRREAAGFATADFGRLPVLHDGRVKPLDTIARTGLLLIQNRQRVRTPEGATLTPRQWLLDVCFRPERADTYAIFRIDNDQVLALLRLAASDGDHGVRFSFRQLEPHLSAIAEHAARAEQIEPAQRSPYERELLKLRGRLARYLGLRCSFQIPLHPDFAALVGRFEQLLPTAHTTTQAHIDGRQADTAVLRELASTLAQFQVLRDHASLLVVPPASDARPGAWQTMGDALVGAFHAGQLAPAVREYVALGKAWRAGDAAGFNQTVAALGAASEKTSAGQRLRLGLEFLFNQAEPFYWAAALYVLALLLAFVSWLVWPGLLSRCALSIGGAAWLLTSAGIVARMIVESRPPVTNLYSSALFVGWVGAGLALIMERLGRNGIGSVVAGALGFLSLVVAHHLSFAGDTMEMMRAVLDSNFWLSVHVVTITMGYGAGFVAGALALVYILRGTLTRSLDRETADSLSRMVYGTLCFATLFSLIGTVTGGIWADQAWGRFWGWDPKENGALVIVLWNAAILHARWAGLAGPRGIMGLTVFGNCITAASWFGVNMLGVGLHSYGFMDSALAWLVAFWLSQLAVIALGRLPLRWWQSGAALSGVTGPRAPQSPA